MLQLKETLYINDPEVSLHLSGKALQARDSNGGTCHIPSHLLEKLVTFSHTPASPQVPEYGSKVPRGLLPWLQAQLLARVIRGDEETYSSVWRRRP